MIILGIDPAIRTTGYGIIRASSLQIEIADCGIIENSQKLPHSECVRRLFGGIDELCDLWHPDWAVLEDPFVGKNARTAIILGMARGAILTALANRKVPACSYAPTVAKRAAVGNGSAKKEQIALLLSGEFNIEIDRIPLDCTDALALALCHTQRLTHPEMAKLSKIL